VPSPKPQLKTLNIKLFTLSLSKGKLQTNPTMENTDYNIQDTNQLTISNEINAYLRETVKWGNFLAIMGYIGIGLLVLLAIFMIAGFSALSEYTKMPFPMGIFGVIYIAIAVLYYFPVSYLQKFSAQVKMALAANNQASLTTGFENLKSLFKFLGIFTIVILSIYALVLLIAIPAVILAA